MTENHSNRSTQEAAEDSSVNDTGFRSEAQKLLDIAVQQQKLT